MGNNKQQAGVALIQVLLLTTLLLMMALHFTLSSGQQVDTAAALDDKMQAELKLHSAENELLFALLTLPKSDGFSQLTQAHPIGKVWNFYNDEFFLGNNVSVHLQDLNGLVSLYAMRQRQFLAPVLSGLGFSQTESRNAIDTLRKWQSQRPEFGGEDGLRHNFLPDLSEMKTLIPMTLWQEKLAEAVLTTFPTRQFNPYLAPVELWQLLYGAKTAEQLLKVRASGQLTANKFIQLARIEENDSMTFTVGNTFRITLEARHGDAVAKKSFICYIRDQSRTPIIWIQ